MRKIAGRTRRERALEIMLKGSEEGKLAEKYCFSVRDEEDDEDRDSGSDAKLE
jgi:hypothetical protein